MNGTSEARPETERLKAYIVSDVHLNNHPWDRQKERENPRRRNFREFLTQINELMMPQDKAILILNGDILDITGSWFEDVMPWDQTPEEVEKTLHYVLLQIIENNATAFAELRRFIEHPENEIVYVVGNHDGLLAEYPSSHRIIREAVHPDAACHDRIKFVDRYESEALDLYVEHGHLHDPFNHAIHKHPPLGDVINVLIVNRFVEMAVDRLRTNGYSEEIIQHLRNHLHDIEYLRPLTLLPVWVQTMAHHYRAEPESRGKRESVEQILIGVVSEILQDRQMMAFMTRSLKLPRALLVGLVKTLIRIPAILPVISYITTRLVRRTHNNKYQYKMAKRIQKEKGYRLIAFGHTHVPGVLPLSETAYYFNTGSWKPVINLFKFSKDPIDLEYLAPEVQFNKVERCGILRIEKTRPDMPAQFALQTIQSGIS